MSMEENLLYINLNMESIAAIIDNVRIQKDVFMVVRNLVREKTDGSVIALGFAKLDPSHQRHLQVLHPPTHVIVKLEKAVNGG